MKAVIYRYDAYANTCLGRGKSCFDSSSVCIEAEIGKSSCASGQRGKIARIRVHMTIAGTNRITKLHANASIIPVNLHARGIVWNDHSAGARETKMRSRKHYKKQS